MIGHVARVAGVSVSTVRSWESQGLILPDKSEAGHRTYSQDDVERAQRIERYRTVSGMSLASVRQQLAREDAKAASRRSDQGDVAKVNEPVAENIGARVRNLRKQMGWTLRELSERSGISQSQLSTFERGRGFLGSARLSALAGLFGHGLTELLGGTNAGDSAVMRRGTGRIVRGMGDGISIEQVTVAERLMDAEFWTIEPGGESDGFYSHEGEELIYVLEGEFELSLADSAPETLRAGDTAYFNSRIQHRWSNRANRPAVVLWVNTDSDRLASMRFGKADRKIGLGAIGGSSLGEGSVTVDLPVGVKTYRAIETHTAGHTTRILIEPLAGLDQPTLQGKIDFFRQNHDHIRPLLLGEPRGHAASFGLVPVKSEIADFGAFFLSAEGYPIMGNHAIIGYARVLRSLSRLAKRRSFTIEVPSAVIGVEIPHSDDPCSVTISLPGIRIHPKKIVVQVRGRSVAVELGTGMAPAALVDVASLGLSLEAENTQLLSEAAGQIRMAIEETGHFDELDSVVFYGGLQGAVARQFTVINSEKFDRSPGILGAATRAAQLVRDKRVKAGATLFFESLFGDSIQVKVTGIADLSGDPKVDVKVTAKSHLNAITTFIHEPTDHPCSGVL